MRYKHSNRAPLIIEDLIVKYFNSRGSLSVIYTHIIILLTNLSGHGMLWNQDASTNRSRMLCETTEKIHFCECGAN